VKLFTKTSNVITIPQRYGQTDGQTICRSNIALCVASRDNHCISQELLYTSRLPSLSWSSCSVTSVVM